MGIVEFPWKKLGAVEIMPQYTQEDIKALPLGERERLRPEDTHSVCGRTAEITSNSHHLPRSFAEKPRRRAHCTVATPANVIGEPKRNVISGALLKAIHATTIPSKGRM